MIWLTILIFIIALAVLLKGADLFVDTTVKIAKYFNVSDLIIGLTLVSIGTSLPELANSIMSSISGNSNLMLGNILGANIINLCLNLGLSSIIVVVLFDKKIAKQEGIFLLGSAVLVYIFAWDKIISRFEGFILLLLFIVYMGELFEWRKKLASMFLGMAKIEEKHLEKELNISDILKMEKEKIEKISFPITALWFIAGIIMLYFGSKYLVDSAVIIATLLKIPESTIGFSIVALGTTLPEMTVSLISIKKKKNDVMIGNVIGSNIVNILLILGLGAFICPVTVEPIAFYMIPMLLFVTLLFLVFIIKDDKLQRKEGVILLVCYILFMLFLAWKIFGFI